MKRIGVISDTHGLARPETAALFEGVDLILHAGDVGGGEVLDALRRIAPVHAVRGNTDHGDWCAALPLVAFIPVDGARLCLLHNAAALTFDPMAAGVSAVIHGHSHRAEERTAGGVLYFNPGSAGPRRWQSAPSVGRLCVADGRVTGEILLLPA
jgi:putative phosphoesterase